MKKPAHVEEAERIGGNSWPLQNFEQLPRSASKKAQIAALLADKRWQDDHVNEAAHAIDRLIDAIENS